MTLASESSASPTLFTKSAIRRILRHWPTIEGACDTHGGSPVLLAAVLALEHLHRGTFLHRKIERSVVKLGLMMHRVPDISIGIAQIRISTCAHLLGADRSEAATTLLSDQRAIGIASQLVAGCWSQSTPPTDVRDFQSIVATHMFGDASSSGRRLAISQANQLATLCGEIRQALDLDQGSPGIACESTLDIRIAGESTMT